MKTRYYHILDKNDNIIYVGLTTTTIGQRFCRHIITKKLNRIDYRCVQIDEIDNGKITSLEDYYREKKRSGELERYYIKKARDEGANLLNISIGGEWNGHILTKILKKDFFDKYGTYDGYLEYKKEYERQERESQKFLIKLRNWIYNRTVNKYRKKLTSWIGNRTRNRYKRLLQKMYYRSKNKYRRMLRRWVNYKSKGKYKRFIKHWYGHRVENPYKNLLAWRVHRNIRNQYKYILTRLIIRRTEQDKIRLLKKQGLYKKSVKMIYKSKLKEWVRYKTMNPYKRILKQLVSHRNRQLKKLNLTNLPQNNDK